MRILSHLKKKNGHKKGQRVIERLLTGKINRNRRKKVRLETSYWKNVDGSIKVTIKVMDGGDFPTAIIFGSNSGYPADGGWVLGEGTLDSISNTLPTPDEAKQWALAQINAVKERLNSWRNIPVPEPEEFEI